MRLAATEEGEMETARLIPAGEMPNYVPGTSQSFWNQRRYMGTGPRFIKLGRKVFYRPEDVDIWISENEQSRT